MAVHGRHPFGVVALNTREHGFSDGVFVSACTICDEPLMADQGGRHIECAPRCVECGASVDSRPYPKPKHVHRTNGQCWHLVLAWIARRLAPPTPVRWWTPGLYDEIDEYEVGL